jgi:hypothetical protein
VDKTSDHVDMTSVYQIITGVLWEI